MKMEKEDEEYILEIIEDIQNKAKERGWREFKITIRNEQDRPNPDSVFWVHPESKAIWFHIWNGPVIVYQKPFMGYLEILSFLYGFWAAYTYLPEEKEDEDI